MCEAAREGGKSLQQQKGLFTNLELLEKGRAAVSSHPTGIILSTGLAKGVVKQHE